MKHTAPTTDHNSAAFHSLTPLICPRSVAIIGASADPTRIGGRPIAYMLKNQFQGQIYPVNPNRETVQGLPAYAAIADLPDNIDLAVIAVAADLVLPSVKALGAKGVKALIVFSSGFSEVGLDGVERQRAIVAEAAYWGMRLLGPNSLGVFNANIGLYCNFASGLENTTPLPGRIGIATQSGAYGAHLYGVATARGMGTPICVATGNEADISLAEVIGWMAASPDVDVIMAYAESINDVATFITALSLAHQARKPIILQKVGNSVLGQQAALTHTASLTGDDELLDTLLRDYAVLRVSSSEQLIDFAYAASQGIFPVDNSLGMVTISGGAGIMVSDAAEALGLPMPPMPADAQAKLKAAISFCSPLNPVDCTAHVLNDLSLVGYFTETMAAAGGYQSLLAYFSQSGTVPSVQPQMLAEFKKIKGLFPDRLFVMTLLSPHKYGQAYDDIGMLVFEDTHRAVAAIAAMGQLGMAFARPLRPQPDRMPPYLPSHDVTEAEAQTVLSAAGLTFAATVLCPDVSSAVQAAEAIGYPVVLKIASADIMHKSDVGGVVVNIGDAVAMRVAYTQIMANVAMAQPLANLAGVLVARYVTTGVACFMGSQHHVDYGPMVTFGLGGIFVEVLKDVVCRRCPVSPAEAMTMIHSIQGAPLLQGVRGGAAADLTALAEQLSRLSYFAYHAGSAVQAVDLNPVLARPDGAVAVDAVLQLNHAHKEAEHGH
ncbi:MAG: acetate--CoA ligase family protein [Neisseriaceae bacterium]|nr:acetate--CoA ligase family protein [Neisseriaceae bacterium]